MRIFDIYKKYKIAYENYISVMCNMISKKEWIPVILNGHKKRSWLSEWVFNYADIVKSFPQKAGELQEYFRYIQEHIDKNCVEFEYKNHHCIFYGAIENGKTINGDLLSVFFREDYKFLSPERSIVIDIGANVGDTAIFFCLNNANHVIALEPLPFSYKSSLVNITANNMNDKIEILNAGYGQDAEVNVEDKKSNGSSQLKTTDEGLKINIYSLLTLLKKYNFNDNDNLLLKMDCEGCEYNLLEEPIKVLRKFNRIEIEYHYGYKNLKSKLEEAGFYVHYSKPSKSSGTDPYLRKVALVNKDYTVGMIYAERHSI